jgi:hypothetical protein
MPKDEFERKHPAWKDKAANTNLGPTSWVKEGTVRIAEYMRRVEVSEKLLASSTRRGMGARCASPAKATSTRRSSRRF